MSPSGSSPSTTTNRRVTRRVCWGDKVRTDFTAWLEDGTMIDTSIYDEPLVFTTGDHTVLPGLEDLVIGMTVGESKTEQVPAERAFGLYRTELSRQVSASWLLAHHVTPSVGTRLEVQQADGTSVHMMIADIEGDRVTLDANHRLAGKALILQLDLLDILEPRTTGERGESCGPM